MLADYLERCFPSRGDSGLTVIANQFGSHPYIYANSHTHLGFEDGGNRPNADIALNDAKENKPRALEEYIGANGTAMNESCRFAWRQNATPGRRITCSSRVITDANQQIADFAQRGMFIFDLMGSPKRNSRPR